MITCTSEKIKAKGLIYEERMVSVKMREHDLLRSRERDGSMSRQCRIRAIEARGYYCEESDEKRSCPSRHVDGSGRMLHFWVPQSMGIPRIIQNQPIKELPNFYVLVLL